MDATENDVPSPYQVRGFPTLYFAPKNDKNNPRKYEVRILFISISKIFYIYFRVDVKLMTLLNI
jgi:hypothetical protein